MEDGKFSNEKEDIVGSTSLDNLYCEHPGKYTTNGHELTTESSSPARETLHVFHDVVADEKSKKRVNPLKIHLGKRPFVDNSLQQFSSNKKKATVANRPCEPTTVPHNTLPRVPKLIPKKKVNRSGSLFHNVTSQSYIPQDEQDKPVPRLVPKSQLLQYKKSAAEKAAQANEYQQNTSMQPMVKFQCRKCCSMSFKTLAMLKEHQQVCRAQAKAPALSTEAPASVDTNTGGPSRVTKKVYLCSACGTYYENWNLFLHMREVHNRHICLFCLGMFSKAEKLSAHLTNKHNVQEYSFDTKEDFFNIYNGTLYLMCCECDEICCEKDDFFNHDCNNVKPKPVPVLVSKNASKINSIKQTKSSETMSNGPPSIGKDMKSMYDNMRLDKRPSVESKQVTHIEKEPLNYDTSISPDSASVHSGKETLNKTVDNRLPDEHKGRMTVSTQNEVSASNLHEKQELVTNGDEIAQNSDRSESPEPMDTDPLPFRPSIKDDEHYPPVEKENCGIKLKLSLNKANSPIIINSTVDPTVGLQNPHKPPTRTRRPPKRYEKDGTLDTSLPRTPSIKMTICDKADSPFVKTTIYENNQETTLLNNNLETTPKSHKMENTVFSTIYDNKLENLNTLNRVPKLTVRVPKELLDKDSSSDYSSDSDVSEKLTVDEGLPAPQYQIEDKQEQPFVEQSQVDPVMEETKKEDIEITKDESIVEDTKPEQDTLPDTTESQTIDVEKVTEEPPVEEIPIIELKLDRPLDKYPLKELLKLFLSLTSYNCIYCNHARKIAVNCEQLSLHMAAQHRFSATVDSITAEELMPETITSKIKTDAVDMCSVYINLDTYDSEEKCEEVKYDNLFECFQCYFKTPVHKDLCLHLRKMHQKTIMLCVMCKTNFYSYSELLGHLCPGTYDSEYEIRFRCCLCNVDSIPSSFRLMVHLRKIHNACDVCLEFCHSQAKLSNHVWKHKLHHLCYRCGIAYRNKPDITKHLFWKHGTESVLCKRCLQKKWPHIYHFCTPPAVFVCDECNLQFTKAVYLKVHKRFHTEEYPHLCIEEGCTEKFVAKKLMMKHLEEHQRKLATVNLEEKIEQGVGTSEMKDANKEPIPIIDLEDDKSAENTTTPAVEVKPEGEPEQLSKKAKKKKLKDKDALLLDVNLPELNLSESDSSDESDSGVSQSVKEEKVCESAPKIEEEEDVKEPVKGEVNEEEIKLDEKPDTNEDEKPDEKQVLEIWDNFKKYQAKTELKKEKTPPLVPIKKHVCESDHDYCLIPTDLNGEEDPFGSKKKKKKDKKRGEFSSSSSSSSSDSDSSCSCGSKCSCSSSSGSSSSSSSDSDSSDEPNQMKKLGKKKQRVKTLPNRRLSTGSNVDVMGMSETPILIPEKIEPPIAETDLETEESDTDEEFYDEHPQKLANKLYAEKRNQLMLLASVAPSDGGSMSREASRPVTPIKDEHNNMQTETEKKEIEKEIKSSSSKKKSKKKKKSKSKKHEPIKINIPKDVVPKPGHVNHSSPIVHNKITISLQSNTVQIPEAHAPVPPNTGSLLTPQGDNKRASKRRRVPNKFYGYTSDDESMQTPQQLALKPQQPPKLEWRKEDLPSPVSHRTKKEVPTSTVAAPKTYNTYIEPIRLTAPIPDPEPPRILMNTESMESSDSDSSEEGALEIYERGSGRNAIPVPPPTYLNSGTSSLPYPFQRPAGRQAREGESVYCYCRCPYDEVSEMIACDAEGCTIEWFHFECVGIMVPPKGKWYCPECRKKSTYAGYR